VRDLVVGHVVVERWLRLSLSPATLCPVGSESTRDAGGSIEAQSHAPTLVTSLWTESARVEGVDVGSLGLSLVLVEAEQLAGFRQDSFNQTCPPRMLERPPLGWKSGSLLETRHSVGDDAHRLCLSRRRLLWPGTEERRN
jgi:hypothetical protein